MARRYLRFRRTVRAGRNDDTEVAPTFVHVGSYSLVIGSILRVHVALTLPGKAHHLLCEDFAMVILPRYFIYFDELPPCVGETVFVHLSSG